MVLDILKTLKLSYRSVPNQGTGHIPKHETKSSHNTGVAQRIFSLVFCISSYSVHHCNGYGILHIPHRESPGQLCCSMLNHTSPETMVPISCAFSTRVKFPSSDTFKLCLQSWRNFLPTTGSTANEALH